MFIIVLQLFYMFLFIFHRHRSCSQTWYGRIYCRRSCDSRSSFIIFRSSKMVLGLAIKRSICFIGEKISLLDNAPNFDESENKPRPDYNNIPINLKLKHFQGWFTPGQIFVLDEYCARYGVRSCFRHLRYLEDLLDRSEKNILVDPTLIHFSYAFCASHVHGNR